MKYTIESPVYIGQSVWAKYCGSWRKYEVYAITFMKNGGKFCVKYGETYADFENYAFPFDKLDVTVFESCPDERVEANGVDGKETH